MGKRMFASDIVESDAFLDMPLTAQALYMHLNMNADNDGFVNPKRIVRMTGAANDDLQILIAKRFLLAFDSGVVVIKHWWINNTKRHDRHVATNYQNELDELITKNNRSYTLKSPQLALETGVGNQMATTRQPKVASMQYNAAQSNAMQDNTIQPNAGKKPAYGKPEVNEIIDYWELKTELPIKNRVDKNRKAASIMFNMHGMVKIKQLIDLAAKSQGDRYAPTISDLITLKDKTNELLVWMKKKHTSTAGRVV